MRVNSPATALRLFLPVLALLCLACGQLTELTGGSGAGNPGGTVTFSIQAGITAALNKSAGVAAVSENNLVDSTNPIEVSDMGGLKFTITGVLISNIDIHFMLDSLEFPDHLLSSLPDRSPGLASDTHSIFLADAHRFNALTGKVSPALDTVRLPVAKYTGVELHFSRDTAQADFPEPGHHGQIIMSGTFIYNGETHKFSIDINRSLWPYYRFAGGIFTLSHKDTTHLQLQFDAKRWLSRVDFGSYLSRGWLGFDRTGALNISSFYGHEVSEEIEFIVSEEFIASGKLVVY